MEPQDMVDIRRRTKNILVSKSWPKYREYRKLLDRLGELRSEALREAQEDSYRESTRGKAVLD